MAVNRACPLSPTPLAILQRCLQFCVALDVACAKHNLAAAIGIGSDAATIVRTLSLIMRVNARPRQYFFPIWEFYPSIAQDSGVLTAATWTDTARIY